MVGQAKSQHSAVVAAHILTAPCAADSKTIPLRILVSATRQYVEHWLPERESQADPGPT